MRWLVGDIQGCALELEELLEEVRFDPNRDELWCLGDLINRGPNSLETLRLWRDVGGRGVLGNHDVYALLAHSGRKKRHPDTLDALFEADDAEALLERLRALPLLAHLPGGDGVRDVWVIHAGLNPTWGKLTKLAKRVNTASHDDDWLESPDVRFGVRVRCCTEDGKLCAHSGDPLGCPPPARPWDEFYTGDALVVHGHWAQRGYYRTDRTMGLDTGCVYGGQLTAWCQEEDRIVRVRGRNVKGVSGT
jgi:bis(5'-nucleosyl)-tetraphosphatase (symmetrical)